MKRIPVLTTLIWTVALVANVSAATTKPEALVLQADDGVQVYGDWYRADHPKALILLFHQAGANRGEYETIAPKLVSAGYSAMAIDQRAGGKRFDRDNETVAALGRNGSYDDAIGDLDAALSWGVVHAAGVPIVLWGSSYSASLVFLVAARHPSQVAAVVSFSPGEYLAGGDTVARAAAKITVPVFIASSKSPDEVAAARSIFNAVSSGDKTQFVPNGAGVHGASTLREDRNPKGAAENWAAVLAFLSHIHREE